MENYTSSLHVGEIIQITDPFTIIVNAGKEHLNIGEHVQIYAVGEPLHDLDGKYLTHFEYIKDELEVVRVEPYYSICKKKKVTSRKLSFPVVPLLEQTLYENEPLNVATEEIKKIPAYDSNIHVGDFIKKICN